MLFRIFGGRRVFSTLLTESHKDFIRDEIAHAKSDDVSFVDVMLAGVASGLCAYAASLAHLFSVDHKLRAMEYKISDMRIELSSAQNKILSMERHE